MVADVSRFCKKSFGLVRVEPSGRTHVDIGVEKLNNCTIKDDFTQ